MSGPSSLTENNIKETNGSLAKLKKTRNELNKYIKKLDRERDSAEFEEKRKQLEKLYAHEQELQNDLNKERAKFNQEQLANMGNAIKENLSKSVKSALTDGVDSLQEKLETNMSSWLEKQESIAYNLNGSFTSASKISDNLSKAFSGTGIVKQQKVYEKLTELVESGIFYNVEQRAYLATIAEDLGMKFDATNNSLNRLIRLQANDLSDNLMAIEANLKTFLNQNYQNSEYIADSFYDVSSSLLEAQSLMSSTSAMELEEVVQQWMGSLYSVGMSDTTVKSLAEAIGQLGSGNTDVLTSSVGKLINMGASVAGLPLGELLNTGLTQDSANKLISGVVSYLSTINENSSNVVKSSLASIFGVTVSDIVAASSLSDLGSPTTSGIISDNIGYLLTKTDDYVYSTQKIENILENFMYSWGMSIASENSSYLTYKIADIVGDISGTLLGGTELNLGLLGTVNIGEVLSNAGIIAAMALGGFSTLSNTLSNVFSGNTGALDIYNTLAGLGQGDQIKMAGNIFSNSLSDVSSSAVISTRYGVNLDSEAEAAAQSATTSATTSTKNLNVEGVDEEEAWKASVKDSLTSLLDEVKAIPLNPFNTYTRISEAENTVTIGNDMTTIQNMMAESTASLKNIYSLLSSYFINSNTSNQTSLPQSSDGLMTNGFNITTTE